MPTLNWLTREEDVGAASRVPYRLLEEVPELSAGDPDTGNMLVQGDNLDALKSLVPFYRGRVKCIYIDPPFNTGQAFENYDDSLEYSIWLGVMFPRLVLLRDLLREDGTIAVHIDDTHLGNILVILDEVFGRKNRVNVATFQQAAATGHKAINPGMVTITSYVVFYAANKDGQWRPNRLFVGRERDTRYGNFIKNYDDPYPEWELTTLSSAFSLHIGMKLKEAKEALGNTYEDTYNEFVIANHGRVVQPVTPSYDDVGQETRDYIDLSIEKPNVLHRQTREGFSDFFVKNGKRWLFYTQKLKEIDGEMVAGEPVTNLWDGLRSNNLHAEGGISFPKGKKPEALIRRVFDLFSKPGDLVLDSFLGSGTTAAVAHKMGRRYIGIEMGEQAVTHCAPRLARVIEGEQGGVSKAVGWGGGGGFRFFQLGPSVFDEEGRIRESIGFDLLATHVWFAETHTPLGAADGERSPLLGVHEGRAIALLYNGVLGDKRPRGGNVLTRAVLADLREAAARANGGEPHEGAMTVYGEQSRLSPATLKVERVTFKQTPYDVSARE